MPTYRGLPACDCLAEWLPVFEKMIGRAPLLFQLAGDAPASAGFHRNGGSVDYEPLSENELRIARNMGGAAWNRWWADNYHSHTRLNGCTHNSIGQPQVEDLNEGRDGTGPLYDNAGAPDNGPRSDVHWPLRTWRQGIEWANDQLEDDVTPEDIDKIAAAVEKRLTPVIKAEVERQFGDLFPKRDLDVNLRSAIRELLEESRKKR